MIKEDTVLMTTRLSLPQFSDAQLGLPQLSDAQNVVALRLWLWDH